MSAELADSLAKRYINTLELSPESTISSIMDFFNSTQSKEAGKALNAL